MATFLQLVTCFDFRGGKSRIVTILIYVKSTKALLVKRHILRRRRRWRNREFSRFVYRLFTGSVLIVRISFLEYSNIHEKPYKFIVCEFKMYILRDASVRAIPT